MGNGVLVIVCLPYSRILPSCALQMQVTISKFHALNFKIGASMAFWTLLKKVHAWRKRQYGTGGNDVDMVETDQQRDDAEDDQGRKNEEDKTVTGLLKQLKKLQKSQHTLDLACSIYADVRVRKLGYMFLDTFLD